jgi:hypothetical protein
MNINRRIQLTAAAVIANGALALGLASSPALASVCNPWCIDVGNTCPSMGEQNGLCQNVCQLRDGAGCTGVPIGCGLNECADIGYDTLYCRCLPT